MLFPGSSQLLLATYSSSALSPHNLQLLPIALSASKCCDGDDGSEQQEEAVQSGKVMKSSRYSSSSAGTSTGSSAPPHVPLVHDPAHRAPESSSTPWCFETISALERLARWLRGNFLLSVLTHLLL